MSEMMHADEIFGAEARARRTAAGAALQPTARPLAEVLDEIKAFVRRYVVLTDDQAIAVTLWVAHTHAIAAADCSPYLQITSATAEAGKTRLLEVLELVVARPWLTGRTSAAALVRKIDAHAPTLLLDESDAAFNGEKEYAEALRGLLNTGYRRSGRSTLCVGQGANLTFKDFSTFSPKAIAGIGKLPDTVASRAIRIELRRRTKAEAVQKFRERNARLEADPIRAALVKWSCIVETLKTAHPSMPPGLRDRAEDVLEPLLAIADHAGAEWPARARAAAVALMGTTEQQDINIELLRDIYAVFEETSVCFIASNELATRLAALDSRPWADWKNGKPMTTRALADRLKAFDIAPKPNEHGMARGYHRDRFEDDWVRYLGLKPSNRQNVNANASELAISNRQPRPPSDGLKTAETPINTGLFDGLTIQTPDREDEGDAGIV